MTCDTNDLAYVDLAKKKNDLVYVMMLNMCNVYNITLCTRVEEAFVVGQTRKKNSFHGTTMKWSSLSYRYVHNYVYVEDKEKILKKIIERR